MKMKGVTETEWRKDTAKDLIRFFLWITRDDGYERTVGSVTQLANGGWMTSVLTKTPHIWYCRQREEGKAYIEQQVARIMNDDVLRSLEMEMK